MAQEREADNFAIGIAVSFVVGDNPVVVKPRRSPQKRFRDDSEILTLNLQTALTGFYEGKQNHAKTYLPFGFNS